MGDLLDREGPLRFRARGAARRAGFGLALELALHDRIGRLVARVDLKSDRAAGRLRLLSTHYEPGVDRGTVGTALRAELHRLAQWLGLH